MEPIQARPTLSRSPAAKAPFAAVPKASASSTFFAKPKQNRTAPAETSGTVSRRSASSGPKSPYRTMGPWSSWGKKAVYSVSLAKFRSGGMVPRYTSARYETA